jgi:integrase
VDIKKAWARALRIAGIREFRFHDLRHTFASRLVQGGVPIKAVQELLGHADIKMTMRYAHLAPHNLRDAVSVLSKKAKRPRRVGTKLAQTRKAGKRETA